MSTPSTTTRTRTSRPGTVVRLAAALGTVALLVAAAWWYAGGGRWFVVETPSMGTAMPVGTLVLTAPVDLADLVVGDVITFHAPESGTVYTHRVVDTATVAVTTRGDLNPVVDTGSVGQDDLVGLVAWHAPTLGWALRAVPLVVLGLALGWAIGLRLDPARRSGVRILGASLGLAVANLLLHPWVGLQRMAERPPAAAGRGPSLDVVSTGLLPIRAEQVGGGAVAGLADGEVATLELTHRRNGSYEVAAALDLAWWGWLLVAAACLAPMALAVLLGPVAEDLPATSGTAPQGPEVVEAVGLSTWFVSVPRQPTDHHEQAVRPRHSTQHDAPVPSVGEDRR